VEITALHLTKLLQAHTYNTLHTPAAHAKLLVRQHVDFVTIEQIIVDGPTIWLRPRTPISLLVNQIVVRQHHAPTDGEQFFIYKSS
jgi:hypothetical protein